MISETPLQCGGATACVYSFRGQKHDIVLELEEWEKRAFTPVQTHSLNVAVVSPGDSRPDDTDAIITFNESFPVGVRTADCVPILLFCPDIRAVAAVHAGWKGTLGGIIDNTLETLVRHGADVADIVAAFGPSISVEAYETSPELAADFADAGFGSRVSYGENEKWSRPHIDLQGVNVDRMLLQGMRESNILPFGGCSFLSVGEDGEPSFQSHRRSYGLPYRNLSVIAIPPSIS